MYQDVMTYLETKTLRGLSNICERLEVGMEDKSCLSTHAHLDESLYLQRSRKVITRSIVIQETLKMHLLKMSFTQMFPGFLYTNRL